MSKDLEGALSAAGYALSDTNPTLPQEENVAEQNELPEALQEAAPQETAKPITDVPVQEVQEPLPANIPEPVQELEPQNTKSFDEIDVDSEVLKFLSEKLGSEFSSFDSISEAMNSKPVEIDERVAAINEFVRTTGRSPEDWYKYQSLNPSEMDDVTAVRNQMMMEHSNLSPEEVSMLMSSKYKLDADRYDETETKLSQLKLKMDAESARKSIESVRSQYEAPQVQEGKSQTPVSEDWIRNMSQEVKEFDGLVFELPSGEFTFGIKDDYKKSLVEKHSRLEEHFDEYIGASGEWNFEKLNAHTALIDNIDSIVKSVYQQGMSDGQKKVVTSAANVSATTPEVSRDYGSSRTNIDEQLLKALGGGNSLTFNI